MICRFDDIHYLFYTADFKLCMVQCFTKLLFVCLFVFVFQAQPPYEVENKKQMGVPSFKMWSLKIQSSSMKFSENRHETFILIS